MNKDYSKLTKKELIEECKRKDSEWMGLYDVNKQLKETNTDLQNKNITLHSDMEAYKYSYEKDEKTISELRRRNELDSKDAKIEVYESVVNKFFKRRH